MNSKLNYIDGKEGGLLVLAGGQVDGDEVERKAFLVKGGQSHRVIGENASSVMPAMVDDWLTLFLL